MKLLLIDCFDSFTYNIFHYFDQLNNVDCGVIRYNEFTADVALEYDGIVISPGPGLPKDYPEISTYLSIRSSEQPVLGICLGHQCIAEHFGASLSRLEKVQHGVKTEVKRHGDSPLFNSLPASFSIGHYHSWVVSKDHFPSDNLRITSFSEDGWIMSLQHIEDPVYGLQFHPESVMTEYGMALLNNWLEAVKSS